VLAAVDDLELRADLHALRVIGRVLRAADYKVTAVIVDDVLIDVQAGDTTGRVYGIAFDLGTTTVVATLLDLTTGNADGGGVDAQQAAAVRRGRDHPDQCGDDGPGALGRLTGLAHESLNELAGEVCKQAGVDPGRRATRWRWPAMPR
jgi:uncharacterized 2Fe-2S/4Fe-4S cluster protein (DUF4445 family)